MQLLQTQNLLQLPLSELNTYLANIPIGGAWMNNRALDAFVFIRRAMLEARINLETMLELNEVLANAIISRVCRTGEGLEWAFTPDHPAITEEDHVLFFFEWSTEERAKYLLLTRTTANLLYDYIEDLENPVEDRRWDYSNYRGNVYEALGSISNQELRYMEILGFTPTPATVSPAIPPNSGSLLVREDTSRFSSATWYQAIQDKIITLAGVGGIGSYVGFLLARMHPKSMFIYDDDTVESANMSGQLYSRDDVGMAKVEALSRMVDRYANYESLFAINGRFTQECEASDIMICGFDNMHSRHLFFDKWLLHVRTLDGDARKKCLFIDGRLAAEELQVFAITGDNVWAIDEYQERLFTDSEADETICSYKQTTYMANMIGSLIVNVFVNFVANEVAGWEERDVPFFTSYDGLTMFFKSEK